MKQTGIFISYARNDLDAAKRLYDDLVSGGLEPWLDIESILPGENWKLAIKKAIADSRYFLALLSKHSVTKQGYVQKEVREGLEILDTFPPNKIYLIPIRLDDCNPSYEQLNDLHWLDMFPSWEHGIRRLLDVLNPSNVQPDELDIFIRENVDITKFRHPESWTDDSLMITFKYLGDDYEFIVWDTYYRVVRKFISSASGRWSGPIKLTETEKREVKELLNSEEFLKSGG